MLQTKNDSTCQSSFQEKSLMDEKRPTAIGHRYR